MAELSRRTALRAAAAAAVSVAAAGCDGGPRARPDSAAPASGPPGPGPPPSNRPKPGPPASDRPEPGAPASSGPRPAEIVHGPRDRPLVALTFHGQGDPALATRLLDEVERAGARITVLAVGSWLDAEPAMAGRILAGGHELGNHTEHHLDIARLTPAGAFGEIHSCGRRLVALTGSPGAWFRPSQIRYSTPVIRAQAAAAGYPTCLSYDLDSLDYTDPGTAAVVQNTLRSVRGGSIVSLHLGHEGTVAAMGPIVDGLRRRGLRPVTVTELMR